MRATIANLEKEEKGIVEDFKAGYKHGQSMRQHLNTIRRERLFEACDAESFEGYVKLKRLPIEPNQAGVIARQGEVQQHLEILTVSRFSGRALSTLGTLRIENSDGTKSQDIDIRKVKRVAKKSLSLANGDNVTPKIVKNAIAECYGEKPPKPLGEQLKNKKLVLSPLFVERLNSCQRIHYSKPASGLHWQGAQRPKFYSCQPSSDPGNLRR